MLLLLHVKVKSKAARLYDKKTTQFLSHLHIKELTSVSNTKTRKHFTSAAGCSQSRHYFEGWSDRSPHRAKHNNKRMLCNIYLCLIITYHACGECMFITTCFFCYSPHMSIEGLVPSARSPPLWINPRRRNISITWHGGGGWEEGLRLEPFLFRVSFIDWKTGGL